VEFRIEPTPLSKRRSRRILAATGAIVVAVAIVIGVLASGDARPIATVASATATPASPAARSPSAPPLPSASAVARTGPAPRVVCHDVSAKRCTAISQAALKVADDPALPWPTRIDVWDSLLCGSTFDCPPDRLTGRQVAGSAIVLGETVGVWVNVVEPAGGTDSATFDAWVIRSGPVG